MAEEIPGVPENAEDRPAAWNRLIRCLFAFLRQAVDRRDRDACVRVEAILVRWWDDALSLDGTADLFGIPGVRLEKQWRAASHLTRCAQWIVEQPRIVEQPPGRAWVALGQAIAQAIPGDLPAESGFDPVTTWGWIASLRGTRVVYGVKVPVVLIDPTRRPLGPSPSILPDQVKVPVVLIDPTRRGAVVAELRLELIEGVVGGAFADPEQAVTDVFAAEFWDAIGLAWYAADWALRAEAGDGIDQRFLPAGRFHLDYPGTVDPSRHVNGRSAGGAAAYGWWHAFRERQPDPGVAVLAVVERDKEGGDDPPRFRLKSVEGLDEKIQALTDFRATGRTIDTIVKAGREEPIHGSPRIVSALEVSADPEHGLLARRSSLVEDLLSYLDRLSDWAAELPAYFPDHLRLPGGFDRIRQRVQVIQDRRVWERWWAEQRERLRASGQDPEAMAYDPTRARPEHESGNDVGRGETRGPTLPPPDTVFWDDNAAARFRRAVILGDPGFGKSWLLRHEARRVARFAAERLRDHDHDIELPILVRLPELGELLKNSSSGDPAEALARLAADKFLPARCDRERFLNELQTRLNHGKAVVLLDAWDEVNPDHKPILRGWLESFLPNRSDCRLLVTSCIVGYPGGLVTGAQELELLAFDQAQVNALIDGWLVGDEADPLRNQIRVWPSLRGLSRIPLMLSLVCRAFQGRANPNHGGRHPEFPTRRTELYEVCLFGLLRDWKMDDKWKEDKWIDARLELWSGVALRQFEQGEEQVRESRLREIVKGELTRLIHDDPQHELLDENAMTLIGQAKEDGLLIAAGQDRDASLLFLHRTFQEYLAARALASKANRPGGWSLVADPLDRWSWYPRWEPVILLLAGQLEDPTPLLEMLADETTDDLFCQRLTLAALLGRTP